MRNFVLWGIAVFSSLALAACTNPFGGTQSTLDEGHQPGVPSDGGATRVTSPGKGSEMVVGSSQQVTTQNNRFKLQASVSASSSEVYLETPTRHFKLFSNVQGEFLSENGDL